MTALKGYAQSIAKATGYTDPAVIAMIEASMRDERPMLDAIARRTFDRLARRSVDDAIALGAIVAVEWLADLSKGDAR